ncbi:MAG: permease [Deltaproteobacteria bacterium]|nr:permease [Deltaproteobacteria bacterium]
MLVLVLILIFAAWGKPAEPVGFWNAVHRIHWPIAVGLLIVLGIILKIWFSREEVIQWGESTWGFAKQILPLLFGGVLVAGLLLGRPGHEALIPAHYIESLVGGNSVWANFFASVVGAFMYFATLTEVPILEGLLGSGMGHGPALALLLAGPALSLPNMLVIRSVMGTQKTLVFVGIVIVLSTVAGLIFGAVV